MGFAVGLLCFFGSVLARLPAFTERVEQKVDLPHGFVVIFALAADVADPGGEIGDGDQFIVQPGEIRDSGLMHLPDIALTAGYHTLRFAIGSQLVPSDPIAFTWSKLYHF